MHEVHFAGKPRKKIGFLHGRIAAADHRDFLASEKISVAGGAGGDAVADQFALGLEAHQARGRARGDDQGKSLIGVVARRNLERPLAQIHVRDRAGLEFRAETLRLLAHVFDQVRPENSVGKSGEILNHGGERKLPARLVAVDHDRL